GLRGPGEAARDQVAPRSASPASPRPKPIAPSACFGEGAPIIEAGPQQGRSATHRRDIEGAPLGAIEKLGSFGEGRKRKRLHEYVALVNSFEPELEDLDDPALKARSQELRHRHQESEDDLDEVLPEAFAMVREAARRTIGQRHYDVQVMG